MRCSARSRATIDQIAQWAVIPFADLDVSEGRPVSWELGKALVGLRDCDLSTETRNMLDDLLARLWDVLLRPGLVAEAIEEQREEWSRLQRDALASIGLLPMRVAAAH